ncbi:hypothetical protein [Pseudobdellovibrio exovorus]|uniref:Asparagine synthetase domain-containing protein n=1 Tax=Pseudobdellovibrio exovorus JSS TaxID=1184267 RepID=M4V500_9BACT|nr:hypothetical protein [Pseudobdellovibrio exovorus]AGH94258.1 hypothetical protein A11Q_38 [Pseudobdellovibrio exovorus JSS]
MFVSEERTLNGERIHYIEVAEARGRLSTPLQHAVEAALKIQQQAEIARLPIKLFLSGGIDSEAMARAFLAARVPFTAVIARYNQDMNFHDYETAIPFCEQFGIKIEFIDIDVYQFLEKEEHLAYGHELGCRSPQLAVYMHILDQVDGFPVLAGNPIFPILNGGAEQIKQGIQTGRLLLERVMGLSDQTQASLLRYFEKRQRRGEPFFFQSSSALIMSFLKLQSTIQEIVREEKTYTYQMKCRAYRDGGFDVEPRADKYTGFEKYREEYDKRLNTQYGKGFDRKFREPLEKMNPLLTEKTQLPVPSEVIELIFAETIRMTRPNELNRRRALLQMMMISVGVLSPLPAWALSCCCDYANNLGCIITSPAGCKAHLATCY